MCLENYLQIVSYSYYGNPNASLKYPGAANQMQKVKAESLLHQPSTYSERSLDSPRKTNGISASPS